MIFFFIAVIWPVRWTHIALTWSAVCCHVTVTGAIAVIAAVDATIFVIGTCIWPIVWQPKLVQRFAHAEKARSAIRQTRGMPIKTLYWMNKEARNSQWRAGTHLPLVVSFCNCVSLSHPFYIIQRNKNITHLPALHTDSPLWYATAEGRREKNIKTWWAVRQAEVPKVERNHEITLKSSLDSLQCMFPSIGHKVWLFSLICMKGAQIIACAFTDLCILSECFETVSSSTTSKTSNKFSCRMFSIFPFYSNQSGGADLVGAVWAYKCLCKNIVLNYSYL